MDSVIQAADTWDTTIVMTHTHVFSCEWRINISWFGCHSSWLNHAVITAKHESFLRWNNDCLLLAIGLVRYACYVVKCIIFPFQIAALQQMNQLPRNVRHTEQYISQPLLAQKITKKFLTRSFISVSYHITQNCPFSFSNIFCMHDSWSTSNKFVAQITNVKQNTKLNSFIFLLCSWSIVVHMEHKDAKVGVEWNWDEVAHRYWNQTFGRIPVVHVRTDPVGMRSIGGNSRRENEDVCVWLAP